MTPRQRLNLFNKFDEIAQEYSWKGGMHPEDAISVEREYDRLKRLLMQELGVEIPGPTHDPKEFDE